MQPPCSCLLACVTLAQLIVANTGDRPNRRIQCYCEFTRVDGSQRHLLSPSSHIRLSLITENHVTARRSSFVIRPGFAITTILGLATALGYRCWIRVQPSGTLRVVLLDQNVAFNAKGPTIILGFPSTGEHEQG
ncbi:hypothetical protein F4802DRAFT_528333 [Xylaria palmicola]|nr:hypothetical protein F4802DRAFT_528333 [Xylaria palmicola]